MKSRRTFPKELVIDYGGTTHGDHKKTNNSIEDCAWCSVYVAEAVGQITEGEKKRFHAALVKYAKTTIFCPKCGEPIPYECKRKAYKTRKRLR